MAIKIGWSNEAIETYDLNLRFLLKNWSAKEIGRFVRQTQYVLSRLQEHPESYNPSTKNRKVRRARLNKYITVYYKYYSSKKEIILLSFWNIKQDPRKLKY